MPDFEVTVQRKVTQHAEVIIEAANAKEAEQLAEAALNGPDDEDVLGDLDWSVVDCQDDGEVYEVKEVTKTEEKE